MKWFTDLFTKEDEEIQESDLQKKVTEIKQRIEHQRSQLEKNSVQSFHVQRHEPIKEPTPPSTDQDKLKKEQEMMALKAKLLGKKL